MKKWINERLNERTTIDGAVLVAAGIAFLIFKPNRPLYETRTVLSLNPMRS